MSTVKHHIFLALLVIPFLVGATYCSFRIYHLAEDRAAIKAGYSSINNITYGLLSVDAWKDHLVRIVSNRIDEFELSAEQEKVASGLQGDLARFKEQFKETHTEATDARAALRKLEQENTRLTGEGDQLKESVTNWARAVAERDESLRDLNGRLREMAARLNDSVLKYNELTTNYNASVKRFNDLATNYNSVVNQLNESRKETRSQK